MKPTVSNLIDLLDKPALVKWANKIGLQGISIDGYKSKSKEDGIDYHQRVENFLKFGMLSDDESFDSKMTKFFQDKVIVDVEQTIEHEAFIGRYDVKLMWKDFTFICDMKSSKGGIYLENRIQLAAYAMVGKCHTAIIKLPEFLLYPVDTNGYDELVLALANVWQIKSKLQ